MSVFLLCELVVSVIVFTLTELGELWVGMLDLYGFWFVVPDSLFGLALCVVVFDMLSSFYE